MDLPEALQDIGLSNGETMVYLALLKLGSAPASKIKETTGLHRTTIYDFIEKLINKSLVSHITKNGTKHFSATPPEALLEYVREREAIVNDVLPRLKMLTTKRAEEIIVDTYRGVEGLKTLLNDIIRVGENYAAYGVEEMKFEELIPEFTQQHFRRERELGMRGRGIASDATEFIYEGQADYRFIADEYFNPTITVIYGDRTATIVWEPLTIVIVRNKTVADGHRKHFELLWKIAKEKPKKK